MGDLSRAPDTVPGSCCWSVLGAQEQVWQLLLGTVKGPDTGLGAGVGVSTGS